MSENDRICDILIRMINMVMRHTSGGKTIYPIKIRLDKETFDKAYYEACEATRDWMEKFTLITFRGISVEEVETHNFLIELVMP